jgi:hypothetical protein
MGPVQKNQTTSLLGGPAGLPTPLEAATCSASALMLAAAQIVLRSRRARGRSVTGEHWRSRHLTSPQRQTRYPNRTLDAVKPAATIKQKNKANSAAGALELQTMVQMPLQSSGTGHHLRLGLFKEQ